MKTDVACAKYCIFMEWIVRLIGSEKIDRKPLITHKFPLEQANEVFETQLKAEAAVKVA